MKYRKHKIAKIKVLEYLLTYDIIEFSWLVRRKFTDCITVV